MQDQYPTWRGLSTRRGQLREMAAVCSRASQQPAMVLADMPQGMERDAAELRLAITSVDTVTAALDVAAIESTDAER